MERLFRFNALGFIFAAAHLAAVIAVHDQHYEGSWGGFLLFLLDFPVSLLVLLPLGWNQWFFFGVIGTLWWYVVGGLILEPAEET